MAEFDWNWPKKVDRARLEQILALGFLREQRNVVLMGPNGVGKRMIARNLVDATIHAGYTALFRTAADLLDDLSCDSPELRKRKTATYARPDLLAIDESAISPTTITLPTCSIASSTRATTGTGPF